MPPKAHITHSIAGRIRLRIPSRRGDTEYFERVTSGLSGVEAVEAVEANPLTGSVVIYHGGNGGRVMQRVTEKSLFQLEPPEEPENRTASGPLLQDIMGRLQGVDRRVHDATGGRIDLTGAVLLGLVGAGTLQILRGSVLPAGVSLLWYAFGLAWLRTRGET